MRPVRDPATITAELIASGLAPTQTALLMELVLSMSTGLSTGQGGESRAILNRRAWDRDRKQKQRALKLPDSQWWTLVGEILRRDGNKCTYCGGSGKLTADHVVPLTRGGTNDKWNLTACCIPCNTRKGNKLLSEWSGGQSAKFHPTVRWTDEVRPTLEDKKEGLPVEKERKKGSRLLSGTRVSDEQRAAAIECGCPPDRVDAVWTEFVDYWSDIPGQKGCKLTWNGTWRNWVKRLFGKSNNGQVISNNRTDPVAGRATAREAQHVATMGGAALRYLQESKSAGSSGDLSGGTGPAEVFNFGKRTENAR